LDLFADIVTIKIKHDAWIAVEIYSLDVSAKKGPVILQWFRNKDDFLDAAGLRLAADVTARVGGIVFV